MDDTLSAIAADDSGDARVGDGRTLPDDTAQTVAALGLHHEIDIHTGGKTRAERDGQRSHIPRRSEIFLCKDGINERGRLHLRDELSLRVHHHRHVAAMPDHNGLIQRFYKDSAHSFHDSPALIHGLTHRDLAADGGRMLCFEHKHFQSRRPQPMDGAGGEVAAAAHQDDVITLHYFLPP